MSTALATGVANIGLRPTVDAGFSVEVHLFDFAEDLYGAMRLRVHLVSSACVTSESSPACPSSRRRSLSDIEHAKSRPELRFGRIHSPTALGAECG